MRSLVTAFVVLVFAAGALGQSNVRQLQRQIEQLEAEQKRLRLELANAKLTIAKLERQLEEAAASQGVEAIDESSAPDGRVWEVEVVENNAADKTDLQAKVRSQESRVRSAASTVAAAKKRLSYMQTENKKRYKYKKEPFTQEDLDRQRAAISKAESTHRAAIVILRKFERELAEADSLRRVTVKDVKDGAVLELLARGPSLSAAESMRVGRRYRVEGRAVGNNIFLSKVAAAD